MKSKSTHYNTDTKALFDYGYELVKAGALSGSAQAGKAVPILAGTTGSSSQHWEMPVREHPSAKGWVQDSNGWYYVKDNWACSQCRWGYADPMRFLHGLTRIHIGLRDGASNGKWSDSQAPTRIMARTMGKGVKNTASDDVLSWRGTGAHADQHRNPRRMSSRTGG